MARGNSKKIRKQTKGKTSVPSKPASHAESAQGGSFLKWFFILIAVLIAIDVFNITFRAGKPLFSFKGFEKHFMVQQVVRISGTDTTGIENYVH